MYKINQNKDKFDIVNVSTLLDEVSNGIYTLKYVEKQDYYYLEYNADKFILPENIYNNEMRNVLINVIEDYWLTNDKNIGVLLHGYSGSGKTLDAKILCNKLNVPVIKINEELEFYDFINKIPNKELIIFIDELEKVYSDAYQDVIARFLSYLDGNNCNNKKILFLFTANNIEDKQLFNYLLNRPSRILFKYHYDNLNSTDIENIVNKYLNNKDILSDVINQIKYFKRKTMDNIFMYIDMLNKFPNINIEDIINILNIDVYKEFIVIKFYLNKTVVKEEVVEYCSYYPPFRGSDVNDNSFWVNDKYIGKITFSSDYNLYFDKYSKYNRLEFVKY